MARAEPNGCHVHSAALALEAGDTAAALAYLKGSQDALAQLQAGHAERAELDCEMGSSATPSPSPAPPSPTPSPSPGGCDVAAAAAALGAGNRDQALADLNGSTAALQELEQGHANRARADCNQPSPSPSPSPSSSPSPDPSASPSPPPTAGGHGSGSGSSPTGGEQAASVGLPASGALWIVDQSAASPIKSGGILLVLIWAGLELVLAVRRRRAQAPPA